MSGADLLDIARRVAGAARAGEQVEAYVVRSRDTDVEVFDGEVESLTTASVEGVGVRVIADHRQGFAWAGSLDRRTSSRRRCAKRATTRPSANPTSGTGSPRPADVDGVAAARRSTSGATSSSSVPTDEKVRIALELERATKAADPRIRNVESASYGDALAEVALANSLGVESPHPPHDVLARRPSRSPTTARVRSPATGSSPGARLPISTSTPIPRDAADASVPAARREARPRPPVSR